MYGPSAWFGTIHLSVCAGANRFEGVYKFIYMYGPPLKHGSSRIRYCSFSRAFDLDDA